MVITPSGWFDTIEQHQQGPFPTGASHAKVLGGAVLLAAVLVYAIWLLGGPERPDFYGFELMDYVVWASYWLTRPLLQLLIGSLYLASTRAKEARGAGIALGLVGLPLLIQEFYWQGFDLWLVVLGVACAGALIGPLIWSRSG